MASSFDTLKIMDEIRPDSEETEDLTRRSGYKAAFTTVPRCLVPSSPLFALPRLTVHEWPAESLAKRLRELITP